MPAEPGPAAGVPPWRTVLAAALQRGRSAFETRYLQLASCDRQGHPRNRTVVFRGFGPASEILVLTDRRSAKWQELQAEPRAELAWYFPVTREQMRLAVRVAGHGEDAAPPWSGLRQRLWTERGARGQAEWLSSPPAAPLPAPVADFILLACVVDAADHLQLRPDPQEQVRWWRDGDGWGCARVRP